LAGTLKLVTRPFNPDEGNPEWPAIRALALPSARLALTMTEQETRSRKRREQQHRRRDGGTDLSPISLTRSRSTARATMRGKRRCGRRFPTRG
jgi:hypothetical protein